MKHASVIGIVIGLAAIVGGHLFESGKVSSILQPTAAFIVFGGTAGATLLSFPFRDVLKALAALVDVFREGGLNSGNYVEEIIHYAGIARRNGIIALETEIPKIEDTFLKKAMTLATDHMNPKVLREIMDQENATFEAERRRVARVFETAGGFAPTIGIIGAVLGLIHVMENLSDPSKLGSGIAVAFVATIYGVGTANLLLLPISKKLVNRLNRDLAAREMMLEGVLCIQSGMNPHYLREKLMVFLEQGEEDNLPARHRGGNPRAKDRQP
jgi:chemotaxis protein MotA